jgi:hypothetical protein
MEGIGEKVERVVAAVPEPFRNTLVIHFVRFPNDGYSVKARVAGCCERTFRSRLDLAMGHVGSALDVGVDTLAGFRYVSGTFDSCVRKLA